LDQGIKKVYVLKFNNSKIKKLGEFPTGGDVTSSPTIDREGRVWVGSMDKKVYVLKFNNSKIEKLGEFETGVGGVHSSATIDQEGCVWIGSNDGKVYVLGEKSKVKSKQ